MSLRLRIFLTCFVTSLIVALGTTYLFSNAWVELARAYGLMSLNRRLEDLDTDTKLESGEWAFSLAYDGRNTSGTKANWIAPPPTVIESKWAQFADEIYDRVRKTNLRSGSFETPIKFSDDTEILYYIAFRTDEDAEKKRTIFVAGTQGQLSLRELSPWASPFAGVVVAALAFAALLSFAIAWTLDRAYLILERAIENVGAGRFTELKFPKGGDRSLRNISRALGDMVKMLELKEKRIAEVSTLANEDPMTRIPNFRAFQTYVDDLLKNTFPYDAPPALTIIDLDFFKKVNDTYGHQVGDFVLQEAAKIIRDNIRGADIKQEGRRADFFGRYGGEEFVVVFNNNSHETMHVGPLRILTAMKAANLLVPANITSDKKSFVIKISASLGTAVWDKSRHQNKDGWIKESDDCLYVAKKAGRGRVVRVHPDKKEWPV